MTKNLISIIKDQLVRHEGLRLKPYKCTSGKLTIGVGRNLDARGISQKEAMIMLTNDILSCEYQLRHTLNDIYAPLNNARKAVLINMCFNLGLNGLLSFKNTLRHIKNGDYDKAAAGMLASKWARQVGRRAIELSEIMRNGK